MKIKNLKLRVTALGILILSNLAVMGVYAAFPNNNFRVGTVTGDGVALRSAPSVSATRLELMYNGEAVRINYDYNNINGWSHVQRWNTNTVGYSASQYIHDGW